MSLSRYSAPRTVGNRAAQRVLVVGDGDLSCSASLRDVVATTFDSLEELRAKYGDAAVCRARELGALHGYDAREIRGEFDRIIFNFPHAPGKMNIRRNRLLLGDFLKSASRALRTGGEILIALDGDQDKEWQLQVQANDLGLIVPEISTFEPFYSVRSHRGRKWTAQAPKTYVVTRPDGTLKSSFEGFSVELPLISDTEPRLVRETIESFGVPLATCTLVDTYVLRDRRTSFNYRLEFASDTEAVGRDQCDRWWHQIQSAFPNIRTSKVASRVSLR